VVVDVHSLPIRKTVFVRHWEEKMCSETVHQLFVDVMSGYRIFVNSVNFKLLNSGYFHFFTLSEECERDISLKDLLQITGFCSNIFDRVGECYSV
jgi:hypothetical protein